MYPCNDGTNKERWQDCEDVSGYDYNLPPCHPLEAAAASCEAPPNEPGKNYDPRLEDADDLNCDDINGTVKVIGEDIYDLDRDNDGIGCEDNGDDDEWWWKCDVPWYMTAIIRSRRIMIIIKSFKKQQ